MEERGYRIRSSLNQSYLDMSISMHNKDGSVGRVVPMRALAFYGASILICLAVVLRSFIATVATPVEKGIFVFLWAMMTVVLGKYDGTHNMNVQRVTTLLHYLPKSERHIYTRTTRNAIPFYNIAGIERIEDNGMIVYADKTYGFLYRVVGSASILLFKADQDSIISRVNGFFRKWETDTEIIFMTTKEGQKVYHQAVHMQDQYDNIQNDDPDLRNMVEEKFDILRNYVGKSFKSIHQYMLLKSNSPDNLWRANDLLDGEINESALFIKQAIPCDKEATLNVLASIYQPTNM